MVESLLTQLVLSGRSFRACTTSDEPASDPESDSDVVGLSAKALRGKSRIEIRLADRSKETVVGFVVLTSAPQPV